MKNQGLIIILALLFLGIIFFVIYNINNASDISKKTYITNITEAENNKGGFWDNLFGWFKDRPKKDNTNTNTNYINETNNDEDNWDWGDDETDWGDDNENSSNAGGTQTKFGQRNLGY